MKRLSTRLTRGTLVGVATVFTLPALLAVSCPGPEAPPTGTVIERIPRDNSGVTLRIERVGGKIRHYDYNMPHPRCAVGARWPDCLDPEYP